MTSPAPRNTRTGFTLIELLVVIAIIALLIGILLPALGAARTTARRVVCMANTRSINQAMYMYSDDHDGGLSISDDTIPHGIRNWGARVDIDTGEDLDVDDPYAYWGMVYDEYLNNAIDVWECPEYQNTVMDPWHSPGQGDVSTLHYDTELMWDLLRNSTYCLNGVALTILNDQLAELTENPIWRYGLYRVTLIDQQTNRGGLVASRWRTHMRPIHELQFPSDLMLFQDGYEHKLDGNGDTLYDLYQYDGGGAYASVQDIWRDAYFRHANQGFMAMADGSVKSYDRSDVTDEGNWKYLYNYIANPEWKDAEERPEDF